MGTLEKPNGEITASGEDTIRYLANIHFKEATNLRETCYESKIIMKTDDWQPDWITNAKLQLAFHQFKNKKSPGPDGLRPLVLKNLSNKCIKHILFIYKACLKLAFTPTKWKGSRVVFIPKPGKNNYKTAKSWRPISLTNYILKALERLCG